MKNFLKTFFYAFFACIGFLSASAAMAWAGGAKSINIYSFVKKVLQNSEQAKIARLDRRNGQYEIALAKSKLSPSLSLTGSLQKQSTPHQEKVFKANKIQFLFTLFDGGKSQQQLDVAVLNAEKIKNTYRKNISDIIVRAAKLYCAIRIDAKLLQSYEQAARRAKKSMDKEKIRFDSGLVDESRYLAASSAFYKSQVLLQQTQTTVDNLDRQYFHYVDRRPPKVLPLPTAGFLVVPKNLEQAKKRALENNAGLRIAKLDLEMAQKGISIARSRRAPSVALQGNYGYQDSALQTVFGVSYTFPLASDANAVAVRKALLNYHKARQALQEVQWNLSNTIISNWRNYNTSKLAIHSFKLARDASRRILEEQTVRYNMGQIDAMVYLKAQQDFLSAQKDYLQGLSTYIDTTLSLLAVIGDLTEKSFVQ